MQKVLERTRGPSFALYIAFIPVFGVTRLRFSTSMLLAASMFFCYVVGVLAFQTVETTKDILFQAITTLEQSSWALFATTEKKCCAGETLS